MAGIAALLLSAILYGPAMKGQFLFDDQGLPFQLTMARAPLRAWIGGTRPVLMFTYWMNYRLSGSDTGSYHVFNLLIHVVNTTLVFLILVRLLELAGWTRERVRNAAILGAGVFLVHPLATESVSYIAGRSESLAALFVLAAYTIFLYRRNNGISWLASLIVVVLFGLGAATKENAVALAGLFILTDWLFPPRRNWRLYVLLAPGAIFAAGFILNALLHGGNAGFSIREFTWYQYAFTEARAILVYIRMAVLPFGQSLDH